ncbi:PE-PGRS family protein [Elysia marginata]|uniref:PE-PGRS family protein n=1 Tax=Elysia marginata TaxID=1093978 RepID=A0AAV4HPY2_9GAST|nr:PE-PGRS family protein [Elysia marginata]
MMMMMMIKSVVLLALLVTASYAGKVATFTIQGAPNFDWEDIAYGPCVDDCRQAPCSANVVPQRFCLIRRRINLFCSSANVVPQRFCLFTRCINLFSSSANVVPKRFCLYIADTGDHGGAGAADVIYMVREPTALNDSTLPVVDKLTFSWSEEDAESLFVTPDARLFIISKVSTGRAMLAQLPASGWGSTVTLDLGNTGILKVTTTHGDPQGADLSPDGTELLIVAEEEVFYYNVPDGDFINAVRTTIPKSVYTYVREPNTEGISWTPDGKGFFVIPRGDNPYVYYYAKDDASAGPGVGR